MVCTINEIGEIILYFNFVVTPRNFIIANLHYAIIKLRGVTTKLKYNIFHHANFQGTKIILLLLRMNIRGLVLNKSIHYWILMVIH